MDEENKGFNITALILGIISLVTLCFWYVSIPCAIIAIIFGIIGRKKGGKGIGTAGIVCGIITIVLYIVIVVFVYGLIFSGNVVNDLSEDIMKNAQNAVQSSQNTQINEIDQKVVDDALDRLNSLLERH